MCRICFSSNLHFDVIQISVLLLLACGENQQLMQSHERVLLEISFTNDVHPMSIILNIWILYLQ